ncbi:MAG: rhombosortase [Pseudomonadota bacterium]
MRQSLEKGMDDSWWWRWQPPLLLVLVSLVLALMGDDLAELLRYQRNALLSGELWRLFTGHLVHLGWSHLWLNLAGLVLVWVLVGQAFSLRKWWWLIGFSLLGISCGLLWWLPGLAWYVGLSGLLHGMLLAGSLQLVLRGEREALLMLIIVLTKVVWELWQGPLPGSSEAAGGEVVVQAHALGCLSGAIYAGLLRVMEQRRWISA